MIYSSLPKNKEHRQLHNLHFKLFLLPLAMATVKVGQEVAQNPSEARRTPYTSGKEPHVRLGTSSASLVSGWGLNLKICVARMGWTLLPRPKTITKQTSCGFPTIYFISSGRATNGSVISTLIDVFCGHSASTLMLHSINSVISRLDAEKHNIRGFYKNLDIDIYDETRKMIGGPDNSQTRLNSGKLLTHQSILNGLGGEIMRAGPFMFSRSRNLI